VQTLKDVEPLQVHKLARNPQIARVCSHASVKSQSKNTFSKRNTSTTIFLKWVVGSSRKEFQVKKVDQCIEITRVKEGPFRYSMHVLPVNRKTYVSVHPLGFVFGSLYIISKMGGFFACVYTSIMRFATRSIFFKMNLDKWIYNVF